MKVPGDPVERHATTGDWAGSNVDLPTPEQIDAELSYRVRMADEQLDRADQLLEEYLAAMRAYFRAFATSYDASTATSNAAKEREAKAENVELRVEYQAAKARFEFAKGTAADLCDAVLKATQSRGRLVKRQRDLDGQAPSWTSRPADDPGDSGPPPDRPF